MIILKNKKNYAFTLVELIIVITILAILATIAFVSFQSYTKDARDSNRLSSLKNIETGLQTFQLSTGNYPEPDNKVNITASGTIIGYQGNIGKTVSQLLKINTIPEDPLDKNLYTYVTNSNKGKYQIASNNENIISFFPQSFAQDNSLRKIKTLGDNIGVFLNQNNIPIEQTGTGIDIVNTNNGYIVYLGNGKISGTGGTLRVLTSTFQKDGNISYTKSCKEINDNGLAKGDGIYSINPTLSATGTFQVLCDMSHAGGGWTAFYGVELTNVDKLGPASIPGNSNYGSIGSDLWSSDLRNMIFSGFLISMYSNDNSLTKTYTYNIASQTGFILNTNSSFIVDNIVNPEPDCRFRMRYRYGFGGIYNWEVAINDMDNGATDATCAIGAGITQQSGTRKLDIVSIPDNIKRQKKAIFYIK